MPSYEFCLVPRMIDHERLESDSDVTAIAFSCFRENPTWLISVLLMDVEFEAHLPFYFSLIKEDGRFRFLEAIRRDFSSYECHSLNDTGIVNANRGLESLGCGIFVALRDTVGFGVNAESFWSSPVNICMLDKGIDLFLQESIQIQSSQFFQERRKIPLLLLLYWFKLFQCFLFAPFTGTY